MSQFLLENISHDDLKKYIQEYYNYAKKELNLASEPKIILKKNINNAEDILGKTGYYNPETYEIALYITNRHAKDILRSFAHELIHHDQNLKGFNDNIDLSITSTDPSYMLRDEGLKEMERDAFERGNMMFRTWTDTKKLRRNNMLNEKKTKKVVKKGGKPDFLDLDKDGDKKEPMKVAAKQAKSVKEEVKMKVKMKGTSMKQEGAEDLLEVEDEEEDLATMMSKPKYKAGMSDFDRSSGLRSGPVDTGDELSSDELSGMEVSDDEDDEEIELSPKRGTRAKVDPYDSATSFDRNFKEREKALRAQSRASIDDEPVMSDEELQALILKRQQEKDELQKEIDAYIAQLDDNDEPMEMQENQKNPYPKLFEQRERLLNEAFKTKEERVYNELIRRFIKK